MNKQELINKYGRNSPSRWKRRGFVVLPHALLFDEKLGRAALIVFWVLTAHLFRGKKYVFPSITTPEQETRYSRHTVINAVKELEKSGYLEKEKEQGKVTKYYLKVTT